MSTPLVMSITSPVGNGESGGSASPAVKQLHPSESQLQAEHYGLLESYALPNNDAIACIALLWYHFVVLWEARCQWAPCRARVDQANNDLQKNLHAWAC